MFFTEKYMFSLCHLPAIVNSLFVQTYLVYKAVSDSVYI